MGGSDKKAGRVPAFLIIALLGSLTGALFSVGNGFAEESSGSAPSDHDWKTINNSIAKRKFSLAEQQIGNYIKFHPKRREAYTLGARIARKIHQPGKGIAILDKGISQYPEDKTLLRLKAELLMEQGNMSRSRTILNRVIHPNAPFWTFWKNITSEPIPRDPGNGRVSLKPDVDSEHHGGHGTHIGCGQGLVRQIGIKLQMFIGLDRCADVGLKACEWPWSVECPHNSSQLSI